MRVELQDANGSLSDYTRKARRGPVVVTRGGKPVALLRVLTDAEWEDFVVSTHPKFLSALERSRAGYKARGGISLAEVEQPTSARQRLRGSLPIAGMRWRPLRGMGESTDGSRGVTLSDGTDR